MSVTWIDTPGSALASRSDAIDFTVTGDVAAISVGYPDGRPEERAYRDGVFLAPYTSSTKLGPTVALRRAGGFPASPTVYVDEMATGATPWSTLYDIDFTAQSAQTIDSAGSYQIGGLTWWAKGGRAASHTGSAVVPGVGLRFDLTGGLGYQPSGLLPSSGWNTQVLFAPLSQVAGFNPNGPLALMFRFGATSGWPPSNLASIAVGLLGTDADANAVLAGHRGSQMWFGCHSPSQAAAFAGDTQGYTTVNLAGSDADLSHHLYGIVRATRRAATTFHQPWSGTFPSVMDSFSSGIAGLIATADPTNLGIGILLNSQSTWSLQLTHLRIAQPRNG